MTTRKEERYLIETPKCEEFIEKISSFSRPDIFPTNYNHTLYFNNSEHEVPFETSIKGRRYSNEPFNWYLEPNEKWIFEIKKDIISENSRLREKKRKELKLKEILEEELSKIKKIDDNTITSPLIPYVADSYRRKHFIVGKEDNFRITIDDKLAYYFFERGLNGEEIGREDYSRVEIKIPQHKINSEEFHRIKNLLIELGAEPTISKKDMAYNLLSDYLRKKFARQVQPSDIEIEAKLSLERQNQHVFHQIRNDFQNGLINGFAIPKNFPCILEGGKLHQYLITHKNDYLRISIKGNSKKIISKEDSKIISDKFGLNCIIKRKKIKEPLFSTPVTLPTKKIYRKRKYFIVENQETKNSYCVLIDRCTYDSDELFQMEIEGLLFSSSEKDEKEIIDDIAYLTNQLIKKYNVLKPTNLTKLEWLKRL